MAVDQRSQQSSVNEAGHGNVMRRGHKMRDHFFAVNEALQLVPFGVVPAAAIAVREVVRVQILNGGSVCFVHDGILELRNGLLNPQTPDEPVDRSLRGFAHKVGASGWFKKIQSTPPWRFAPPLLV